MSTIAAPSLPPKIERKFDNAAEFLHSLGDIPPARIIWTPLPGTATEHDLIQLVERDKRLCELVDGTLVEKPVGYFESLIAVRLIIALGNFVTPRNLGFISGPDGMMRLLTGRIRLPDVAFVSLSRLPGGQIPPERVPSLSPDIAIEVLSESNTDDEIQQKLNEYFGSGTRLAWIIDPSKSTVAIYTSAIEPDQILNISQTLDGGAVLPGFTLPLLQIFQPRPQIETTK